MIRREAADAVGLFDEDFFMFSEETDLLYRFRAAGWKVWFLPEAEVVHVGGATHGGRMFVENVRSQLRFFAKHRGPRESARARRLLIVALRLRGLLFRGERGRMYREAARSLEMRRVPWELAALPALGVARLLPETGWGLWARLAAATACLLLPGALIARALRTPGFSAALAWSLGALFCATAVMFAVHSSLSLALILLGAITAGALAAAALRPSNTVLQGDSRGSNRAPPEQVTQCYLPWGSRSRGSGSGSRSGS